MLVSRGGAPGWGVRVSWSWYAHQMVWPCWVLRCGVRVWACWMNRAVLMSSAACGYMGVAYAHNPGVCMPCGALPTPGIGCRVWWGGVSPRCSWRRSPRMSSHRCCQYVCGRWGWGR